MKLAQEGDFLLQWSGRGDWGENYIAFTFPLQQSATAQRVSLCRAVPRNKKNFTNRVK